MFRVKCLWIFVLLLMSNTIFAQTATTVATSEPKLHSPHKASLYSAVLPGLGQAYNQKYWKIPIVYAGIGTISYLAITNRNEYRLAKEAQVYVSNGEEYPIENKYVGKYSSTDLITIRDYYRRNTEVSWIFLGLWYILNIVDATVDAHFFNYDISDEISLQLQPGFQLQTVPNTPKMAGINQQTLLTFRISF
ncbi:MAG: hypothetical protein KG029_17240 [Bacteroidetes bacterium]|jgi:hypothetical protein|nr:hypothetical protein [Bacteroidota bacterium]